MRCYAVVDTNVIEMEANPMLVDALEVEKRFLADSALKFSYDTREKMIRDISSALNGAEESATRRAMAVFKMLMATGRTEDLAKAMEDFEYLKKLEKELLPESPNATLIDQYLAHK